LNVPRLMARAYTSDEQTFLAVIHYGWIIAERTRANFLASPSHAVAVISNAAVSKAHFPRVRRTRFSLEQNTFYSNRHKRFRCANSPDTGSSLEVYQEVESRRGLTD